MWRSGRQLANMLPEITVRSPSNIARVNNWITQTFELLAISWISAEQGRIIFQAGPKKLTQKAAFTLRGAPDLKRAAVNPCPSNPEMAKSARHRSNNDLRPQPAFGDLSANPASSPQDPIGTLGKVRPFIDKQEPDFAP